MIRLIRRVVTFTQVYATVFCLAAALPTASAQQVGGSLSGSLAFGAQRGHGGESLRDSWGPTADLVLSFAYDATHPRRRIALNVSRSGEECLDVGSPCRSFPAFLGIGVLYGMRIPLHSRLAVEYQVGPAWFVSQGIDREDGLGTDRFGLIARIEAGLKVYGPFHLIVAPRLAAYPPVGRGQLRAASLSVGLRL